MKRAILRSALAGLALNAFAGTIEAAGDADPLLVPRIAEVPSPVDSAISDALYLSDGVEPYSALSITQVVHSPDAILRPADEALLTGRARRSRRMSDFVIEPLRPEDDPAADAGPMRPTGLALQAEELPIPAPEPPAPETPAPLRSGESDRPSESVLDFSDQSEVPAELPADVSSSGAQVLVPAPVDVSPQQELIPPVIVENPSPSDSSTLGYPVENGSPSSAGFASWLDIRPRTVDGEERDLVPVNELPEDTSGLAPATDVVRLIQYHHSNLLMADVWAGASFCHQPLYFEDQALERCGTITGALHHCPNLHSAAHFVLMTGSLPAHMALECPWGCVRSGMRPKRFHW